MKIQSDRFVTLYKQGENVSENKQLKLKNPYTDAKQIWNERIGNSVVRARNWRLAAILSLMVSIIAVSGVVYIGSQSKIKPYIVEVDEIGQTSNKGFMKPLRVKENIVKFSLSDFITNYRTIYLSDPNIQKKMIYKTYDYLSSSLPAYNQVVAYYQKNSPFKSESSRQVAISTVLNLGIPTAWQVDWIEKVLTKKGILKSTTQYRATINVVVMPPNDEEEIFKNPLGLYIKDVAIQKVLSN